MLSRPIIDREIRRAANPPGKFNPCTNSISELGYRDKTFDPTMDDSDVGEAQMNSRLRRYVIVPSPSLQRSPSTLLDLMTSSLPSPAAAAAREFLQFVNVSPSRMNLLASA